MSAIDLFSEQSDLYASARPHYPTSLYEFLVSWVNHRERVWDCGTGSGQAAIALANYFSQVEATDVSEQQIANAFLAVNVHYSVQLAESTTFPDAYFDAVTVAQALHWFDLDRFWDEVNRVLRPGGIFAAWGYTLLSISPEIDAILRTHIFDPIEPYWSPRVHLLRNGYRDVNLPLAPIAVPAIAMTVPWNLPELLAYLQTWSATRQCIQIRGGEFFELARDRLWTVWGSDERKDVTMDFHLIAGRKEK